MTTKLKSILLALILVLSNVSSTVFATTTISEDMKRDVITRRLGNDSRKIYIIKNPIKDRDDLIKRYDSRKVEDIKKEVYYAKENENSKYTSAYNNMIKSYDYFNKNFGISSFGSKNSTIFVFPNFKLNQAFSGTGNVGYIALGEKDSKSYATALDAIGHEYTHLILSNKYKLDSQTKTSRAIHEGVADFFGCIIEGKDWKMGNSIGLTMRDIQNPSYIKLTDSKGNPGKYKAKNGKTYSVYPDHYSKLLPSEDQSLANYAYINSTIVSHLLYKIAEGNKSDNKLGKINTGKLVLRALSKAPSNCTIEQFAKLLYTEAYSTEKKGVKASLAEMGLYKNVTSVKLDKTSVSINKGSSQSLKYTVNPNEAFDKSVSWSSSNTKIATVDSKGVIKGIAPGSATITVTTKDGGLKATCKVTVNQPVTSVKLNKTSTKIVSGKNETLKATINPSNAANKSVTWSSNNTKVATVDSKGVVKAISPGTAVITVTTKDGNKKATCKVTVDPYKSRGIGLKLSIPSSFKDKYYMEILDDKNKVLYKSSTKTGSSSYNFTYTLSTASQVHKRKVRIKTVSGNKSYTSGVFSIDKNTINKNITATYNNGKLSISQK